MNLLPFRLLIALHLFQAFTALAIFLVSRINNFWIDLLLALGIIFVSSWIISLGVSIWALIVYLRSGSK